MNPQDIWILGFRQTALVAFGPGGAAAVAVVFGISDAIDYHLVPAWLDRWLNWARGPEGIDV